MKTIIIRLPDVEEAMLSSLRRIDKKFLSLDKLLLRIIAEEYSRRFPSP
jgi:hypothetical protein